jgi:hypothetical protein
MNKVDEAKDEVQTQTQAQGGKTRSTPASGRLW